MKRVAIPLLALLLLGQGCFGSGTTIENADGGVFKTDDRGLNWVNKRVLVEGARGVSIQNEAITALAFDPQDRLAVYAGTQARGLIYSLDGGDAWQPAKGLSAGRIEAVAVDPKQKCVVYATQGNKIFKTDNCGRDWRQAWFDPKIDKVFTTLALDWFNSTVIYAGTSEGDILKSTDAGANWLVSKRAATPITSIVVHPTDSRVVYAGTRGDGIWKTTDGGRTWLPIEDALRDFDRARRVTQLAVDPLSPETLYATSQYGILASRNSGQTWEALPLTSEPGSVEIRAFAINPRNNKELYYITPNTLLYSADSGATWTTQRLPSVRGATTLLVDPEGNGKILYVGMGPAPK